MSRFTRRDRESFQYFLPEPEDDQHYVECDKANELALIEEDGTEVCICAEIQQALEDDHADRMFRERREQSYDPIHYG
jgi:hypothetical protein